MHRACKASHASQQPSLDGSCASGARGVVTGEHAQDATQKTLEGLTELSSKYVREAAEEASLDPEARIVAKVGKLDAKKNVDSVVHALMSANILQCMGTMLDTVVF